MQPQEKTEQMLMMDDCHGKEQAQIHNDMHDDLS